MKRFLLESPPNSGNGRKQSLEEDSCDFAELATSEGNIIRSEYQLEVEVASSFFLKTVRQKVLFPIKILNEAENEQNNL